MFSYDCESELPMPAGISAAMASRLDPVSRRESDVQLMASVKAGRVESFGELYDRYCDRAYRVARATCGDADRAQDAVQEGFLSAWTGRASYRPEQGTVAAWLLTVVRHRAIDLARGHGRHACRRAGDEQLEQRPSRSDPSETVIVHDEVQRIQTSLAGLPDTQAEVITLAFYGQLSHTEIATRLGLPAGTVKGRMRLGLQKLRADLHQATAP